MNNRPLPILLLDLNVRRREQVARMLRECGFEFSVKIHIAEIERWPVGQIVVVDAARFTPWWIEVGAVRVMIWSGAAAAESRVYKGVPCTWIPRGAGPEALLALL